MCIYIMIVKNFVCHLFSIVPSPQSRDHKEPAGAGTSLLGSLKVFDLGAEATFMQVRANRNKLARTYHPDVHRSEITGLTSEGAKQYIVHADDQSCF